MIWKILGIAFVGVVSFVIIKKANSDVAVAISVVTGAIIIALMLQSIIEIFGFFSDIANDSGMDETLIRNVFKLVGVGYLCEYSVSICNDFDCQSIGKKIELGGIVSILAVSIPLIKNAIDAIKAILP